MMWFVFSWFDSIVVLSVELVFKGINGWEFLVVFNVNIDSVKSWNMKLG